MLRFEAAWGTCEITMKWLKLTWSLRYSRATWKWLLMQEPPQTPQGKSTPRRADFNQTDEAAETTCLHPHLELHRNSICEPRHLEDEWGGCLQSYLAVVESLCQREFWDLPLQGVTFYNLQCLPCCALLKSKGGTLPNKPFNQTTYPSGVCFPQSLPNPAHKHNQQNRH